MGTKLAQQCSPSAPQPTRRHKLARKVAHTVLRPEQVDDAVQESYLLVYQKLPQLREPEAFLGWLSRLVLHTCYRFQRKEREEVPLPEQELPAPDTTERALTTLHLRQALSRLKQDDRNLLMLRELLSLSYEEVAYALSIPIGTVKSRLNKARKKLKQRLQL